MKLIVTEKPSVAMAYAEVLGVQGRQDGYLEGNGYLISWCVGHLVELAPPSAYGEQYVKWSIQSCDDGWDYTLYHSDFSVMDGGQIDAPELTIQEVREQVLEVYHMEKGRRLIQDYDFIMDKAAEAEDLGLNSRPSTLEKLALLAGAKEKCDAPECSSAGCRKARDAHEL